MFAAGICSADSSTSTTASQHDRIRVSDPHGVGKAAQTLFATDPITQAAIDTYNQNVGTVAEFLGHQVAISGAIGAAGC